MRNTKAVTWENNKPAVVIVIFAVIVSTAPVVWLWYNSLRPPIDLISEPFGSPRWTLDNYTSVIQGHTPLGRQLLNSVQVVAGSVLLCLSVGSLAAYSLSKYPWTLRFKTILLVLILFIQIVPPVVLVPPFYTWLGRLEMVNTILGLILINAAIQVPFATLLLKIYFDAVPSSLREAARVDGAREFTIFWRIMLPLTKPGMATACLFVGILVWNEFLFAVSLTSGPSAQTATVGIAGYLQEHNIRFGEMAAAATVVSLPAVLLVIFAQKYVVAGITRGAVRG
ncbi:multiple sugar transport system permease protein [Haloactinopolyspora alba]|uniref:Multiple sugar transport system permease protein n=1 Tax=Haloactinopolyspora alba TaxID=648780 RepID=A0A2P8E713_9ACTN|nr:carbohydrate ABC transporter permease [Haloactinopolyspora alba]PSL05264.1 multiple sugar transport system permease protein [Haloactinopolyspora alba]